MHQLKGLIHGESLFLKMSLHWCGHPKTKSTSCHCVFPGNKAGVGSDFKSLDDLKKAEGEATIVEWAKAGWTDYKVKKLEGFVQAAIDKHNEKATETEVESKDTSYAASPEVTPDPNAGAPE